ncbi:hypothetical protein, partial [Paenibacillus polymyxa]|uniref:hypothetical protein n=1 Tax=Paenibacillus polymyxa TaxID=1406 RepID=UPI001BB00C17
QRSNSFLLRFSAAIRSYHIRPKNARVIFSLLFEDCFALVILFRNGCFVVSSNNIPFSTTEYNL